MGNNRHLQHENSLQKERKHELVAWEKMGVKSVSEEIADYHQLLHQDSTVEDALKITIELATQASWIMNIKYDKSFCLDVIN